MKLNKKTRVNLACFLYPEPEKRLYVFKPRIWIRMKRASKETKAVQQAENNSDLLFTPLNPWICYWKTKRTGDVTG